MNKKKRIRKETTELVYEKLGTALAGIKGNVKEKKFAKKLELVSDFLAKDIAKASQKKAGKKGKGQKEKTIKSEKAKIALPKMNNSPASVDGQVAPENIAP